MTCPECRGLSYLASKQTVPGAITPIVVELGIFLVIGIAVVFGSVMWAFVSVGAVVAGLLIAHEITLYRRPLVPTTPPQVAASKRHALWFAAALLGAVLILVVFVAMRNNAV